MPGSENFGLSLSRESGSQLRLLFCGARSIPIERGLRRIGKRPEGESFCDGAADAYKRKTGCISARRHPHWHIRPRLDFLFVEEICIYPGELDICSRYCANAVEHLCHREGRFRPGSVVDSDVTLLNHSDAPFREITRVDELN